MAVYFVGPNGEKQDAKEALAGKSKEEKRLILKGLGTYNTPGEAAAAARKMSGKSKVSREELHSLKDKIERKIAETKEEKTMTPKEENATGDTMEKQEEPCNQGDILINVLEARETILKSIATFESRIFLLRSAIIDFETALKIKPGIGNAEYRIKEAKKEISVLQDKIAKGRERVKEHDSFLEDFFNEASGKGNRGEKK